jgi:hypothetical protein
MWARKRRSRSITSPYAICHAARADRRALPGLWSGRGVSVPLVPRLPASLPPGASPAGSCLRFGAMELRRTGPGAGLGTQAAGPAGRRHASYPRNGGGQPPRRAQYGGDHVGSRPPSGHSEAGLRSRRAPCPRSGPRAWAAGPASSPAQSGGTRSNFVICFRSSPECPGRLRLGPCAAKGHPRRRCHHHGSHCGSLRGGLEGSRQRRSLIAGAVSRLVCLGFGLVYQNGARALCRHNCLVLLGGSGSRLPKAAQSY